MKRKDRHNRIRALAAEMGRATIAEIAKRARADGIYDFEDLQRAEDLFVERDVKTALHGESAEGVRLFIPIEEEYREVDNDGEVITIAPRWQQTDLSDYDEIVAGYFRPALKAIGRDHGKLEAMAAYLFRRFQRRPDLPPWSV